MIKKVLIIVIAGFLALIGGMKVNRWVNLHEASAQTLPLPEFSLADLEGKPHSRKEWQGKFLIINFWATWCPPCLKEMPEFNAMQQQYAGKDLQFIGIALDEADAVKEFIAKNKIAYPILLGGDNGTQLAHSMGNLVDTVPFTVFVNKQGQIVKTHMGELDRDELKEIIGSYLEK